MVLEKLNQENLIAFKYCDDNGNGNQEANPNGSLENIAGILNDKKNILGMMPHPERMVDDIISNKDIDLDLLNLVFCKNLVASESCGNFAKIILKYHQEIKKI